MTLYEILEKVKDDNLTLSQVESYRDQLIRIRTLLKRREAELKKQRALFLIKSEEKTLGAKQLAFDVTPEGQELFTVKGDLGGISGEIDSLQSKIYSLIR